MNNKGFALPQIKTSKNLLSSNQQMIVNSA